MEFEFVINLQTGERLLQSLTAAFGTEQAS